jgi:hypothetical protein
MISAIEAKKMYHSYDKVPKLGDQKVFTNSFDDDGGQLTLTSITANIQRVNNGPETGKMLWIDTIEFWTREVYYSLPESSLPSSGWSSVRVNGKKLTPEELAQLNKRLRLRSGR